MHRKVDIRVIVGLASMPGPPGILHGPWVQVHGGCVTGADIAVWPCCVSLPCKPVAFLGSLHWPADSGDLGHFGISYLEVLVLFEQWAGHRLLTEKVTRPHVRAHRPISISSVPVSEGIEIRQGCRLISGLVRALGKLPWWVRLVLTLLGGLSYVQASSFRLGTMSSCVDILATGKLSSSMPQGGLWDFGVPYKCSGGAFGWHSKALLLHLIFY